MRLEVEVSAGGKDTAPYNDKLRTVLFLIYQYFGT